MNKSAALFAVVTLSTLSAALIENSMAEDDMTEDSVSRVCFFAEPYSGKKVREYTLELPTQPERSTSLTIPQDCPSAMEFFAQGAPQWGNSVQRRLWQKVDADCHYQRFLTLHAPATQDFIGDFDFHNASLKNLPITTDPTQGPACRFENGRIRGVLTPTPYGLHCHPTPEGPGARLVGVDRADVNGDGIQDVVLNLIPLNLGRKRIPIRLPLTRSLADAPFTVPAGLQPFIGNPLAAPLQP